MTPAPPLQVAVLATTCNRPALLADALAGVAAQTLRPAKVLVANDGEATVDAALPRSGLPAVRILPTGGRGPGAARNQIARLAGSELLAFLDDDDRWAPGHLEGLAGAFADPGVAIAYRDSVVVLERVENGVRHDLARRVLAHEWDEGVMRSNDYIPPSALMVRREAFLALGGFDETFRYSEDWDFLLRAARRSTPRRVPGVTVEVRLREQGNLSADVGPERQGCLDRLAAQHGLPPLEVRTFWEVAGAMGVPA